MEHSSHTDGAEHLGEDQKDINVAANKVTEKSSFVLLCQCKLEQGVCTSLLGLRDDAQEVITDAQQGPKVDFHRIYLLREVQDWRCYSKTHSWAHRSTDQDASGIARTHCDS